MDVVDVDVVNVVLKFTKIIGSSKVTIGNLIGEEDIRDFD